MKKIAVDDFGTQWYESEHRLPFHIQRFPAQVFTHTYTDDGIVSAYESVCMLETWIDWGLMTKEEVKAEGFKLRWQYKD